MEATQQTDGYTRSVLVAVFLSVAGIVASQFTPLPALLIDPSFAQSPTDASTLSVALFMMLSFVGFVLVGGLYLWWTDRGWSYVDLRMPTLREWGYAVAAFVAGIAVMVLINLVSVLLDLPSAENQAIEIVGEDPNLVLIMIVIVFLFNAPAEEFLYRNIVQKRLYDAFSRWGAIVVTSVIFAVIHLPTYGLALDGTVAPASAVAVTMVVMFAGSIIFGYVYAKTDNLVVPIAAHALYNGFQLGLLYLVLRLAPEELEAMLAVPGAVLASLPL